MKCDELKALVFSINDLAYIDETSATKNFENVHDHAVYKATDVDAAIEELKEEIYNQKLRGDEWARSANDKDKQIDELKAMVTTDNSAVIANLEDELRKTQCALWLARALALSRFDVDKYLRKYTHCNSRFWNDGFNTFDEACKQMQKAINIAEAKCLAKAEEYK